MRTRRDIAVVLYKLAKYVVDEKSVLSVVLKAHLLIDLEINELLCNVLAKPKILDLENRTFAQKLDLLVAIGTLEDTEAAGYKRFNSIRNNFGHDVDYILSQKEIQILKNSLSEKHKKIVKHLTLELDSNPREAKLKEAIFVLLLFLFFMNCADPEFSRSAGDKLDINEIESYFKIN